MNSLKFLLKPQFFFSKMPYANVLLHSETIKSIVEMCDKLQTGAYYKWVSEQIGLEHSQKKKIKNYINKLPMEFAAF